MLWSPVWSGRHLGRAFRVGVDDHRHRARQQQRPAHSLNDSGFDQHADRRCGCTRRARPDRTPRTPSEARVGVPADRPPCPRPGAGSRWRRCTRRRPTANDGTPACRLSRTSDSATLTIVTSSRTRNMPGHITVSTRAGQTRSAGSSAVPSVPSCLRDTSVHAEPFPRQTGPMTREPSLRKAADIAPIAALSADASRARIVTALGDGRSLRHPCSPRSPASRRQLPAGISPGSSTEAC